MNSAPSDDHLWGLALKHLAERRDLFTFATTFLPINLNSSTEYSFDPTPQRPAYESTIQTYPARHNPRLSARIDASTAPQRIVAHATYLSYAHGRWEAELQARNLTNRRLYVIRSYTDLDVTTDTYRLRPAEALATLRYNF